LLTLGLAAATPQRQLQPADPLEALGIRDLSLQPEQQQAIRVLLLSGKEDEAEKLLLDIVGKNPKGWDARVLLARMEYLNRKPGAAVEQLRAADAIRSLPPQDRLLLAFACRAIRKPDLAIAELKKLSAQDPKNPEYPYWIGRTESDNRDPEHAIATLRKVVSDHPDYFPAYEALGIALERQGKDEAAIRAYQDGIQRDKALHACPPRLYLNLGALQQDLDRSKEAEENLRQSLQCGPTAQAHYRLGVLLQNSERMDDAIEQFRLAIGLQPGYSPPYYNLAGLYRLKGEKDKAEQALKAFRDVSAKEQETRKDLNPRPPVPGDPAKQ
jgi:tetratricopeptide (TPR) repeat protein